MSRSTSHNELIFENKWVKIASRILVLFLLSELFKFFDFSFRDVLYDNRLRSILFTILFIVYGYAVWMGANAISRRFEFGKAEKPSIHKFWRLFIVLALYGLAASYIFAMCYAFADILIFRKYEAWESFRRFSFDLIIGIFLFYMMLVSFNGMIAYYKKINRYKLQTEQLTRENIQARYSALMHQIEPHFFFNSLSVLSNLVYKSADQSAVFINRLAQCYRYILDKKMESLIAIEAELTFLNAYMYLIHTRHENSIICNIDIPEAAGREGKVPPASLQMLVENAIKHNRFSTNEPLIIDIRYDTGNIIVSNTINKLSYTKESMGIGLQNIEKRYELISDKRITVSDTEHVFTVTLPVL